MLDRPEDARLARLQEVFWKGATVSREQAERAVDPVPLADLIEAGVIEIDGEDVRATVKMTTIGGVILAGDVPTGAGATSATSPDCLCRAGRSRTRRSAGTSRRALDVGTGSGIQALLAARHAERVVGTDVNPHALWLAGLGQQLNGIDNTTWSQGRLVRTGTRRALRSRRRQPAGHDLARQRRPRARQRDWRRRAVARDGAARPRITSRTAALPRSCATGPIERADWEEAPREWVAGSAVMPW